MMLAFLTNKLPFSAIFQIFCFFDSDQEKHAIFAKPHKNKIVYDSESVNKWIFADEACRYFSNLTS